MINIKFRYIFKYRKTNEFKIIYKNLRQIELGWLLDFGEQNQDWKSIATNIYTGLQDKNGKQIYEGDIIFNPTWSWGPGEVFLNRGECGPCKGDSVGSYICKNSKHVTHNIWNGKEVEILGNIYENSELMEK